MRDLEVRWARLHGKSIAYAVFGTGPIDVLLGQLWCPIDLMCELPQLVSFIDELGRIARVIVFDDLGRGASDALPDPEAASIETFVDTALAVLDAARVARVVLFDTYAGGNGAVFAATYPQRVQSLITVNFRTSYPNVRNMSAAERVALADDLRGLQGLEWQDPRVAHDPDLRSWWLRAHRLLATREQWLADVEFAARADYGSVLSAVRVPTLVLHRRDNALLDVETSRVEASRIPGARFVELPGSEHDIFLGDTRPVFTAIEQFLAEPDGEAPHDRPLVTVLFTDMVSSTEQLAAQGDNAWRQLLESHDRTMESVVATYRGQLVKPTGDGILATFDGPARAVRCAIAILDAAHEQGVTLRAGLHTGEIEVRSADVTGIAVHIANRIAALAAPNQILVSRTVVDLTLGSDLEFEPGGEHHLKGVPGSWPLFTIDPTNTAP